MKWQYKIVWLNTPGLEAQLNQLGDSHWEVVSIDPPIEYSCRVILKRPAPLVKKRCGHSTINQSKVGTDILYRVPIDPVLLAQAQNAESKI